MNTINEFQEHREAVISYIKGGMTSQGASVSEAIAATTKIYFFNSRDVENLYRCINSRKLDGITRAAIVAHDFNGLASKQPHFLPKSRQFESEA